jgi:hypothetical protein
MKILYIVILTIITQFVNSYSQGLTSHFLIGYTSGLDTNVVSKRGIFEFDSTTYTITPANFKMPFRASQGNLSDENGNLLMVSNGCWIADALGDTMLNGGGLLSNSFSVDWCDAFAGIPFVQTSVFLPHPSDSNLVYLIHQSGTSASNVRSNGLYYTLIDKTLNNGLGGVVAGQKNQAIFNASLITCISVCKHANGRDWWISVLRDSTDQVYTTCLSPSGFSPPLVQSLGFAFPPLYLDAQMNFSPDGKKFGYNYCLYTGSTYTYYIRLADFDRCTGLFSNSQQVSFTDFGVGLGFCFSPNSKNLYVSSYRKIVQLKVDTTNISASMDTVAINDGYYSPFPPLQSDFWVMTPAANGKIYISSGNSVIDLHYINYPDSDGVACDVQQHAIRLPCYSGRGHVYHPNYYLGCDTTLGCPCLVSTGLTEAGGHDFKAKLSPNPGRYGFDILYLLPQNKSGTLTVFDLQGREMHKEQLPPWSTKQSIPAGDWASGIYQVRIESDGEVGTWKWVKF